MPYIVTPQSPAYRQISFDDILDNTVDMSKPLVYERDGTVTRYFEVLNPKFLRSIDVNSMVKTLATFNSNHEELIKADKKTLYSTYYIPKKSGGKRRIDPPCPELKHALNILRDIFEDKMGVLYHTAAHAYVKGRSIVTANKRHQANQSRWFFKSDFSNFFGSVTPEFTFRTLSTIFPFSEIVKTNEGEQALKTALSLCFLDGGLPQGSPISPMLTNLIMIPIDHRIANDLAERNYVYTRYADDILISHRYNFDAEKMEAYIAGVLRSFNAPFGIKKEKTRYGSSAGSNWNLGLMLNKDNNLTVGYRNKWELKATCNSFILDNMNGVQWDLHDVQVLNGRISYYRSIEKDYIDYVIGHLNHKYHADLMGMIKAYLRS